MSWKKVLVIGLIIGSILGLGAYLALTVIGNQLKAQDYANRTENLVTAPYKASELSTKGEWSGDEYELQPAYGYRGLMVDMVENNAGRIQ